MIIRFTTAIQNDSLQIGDNAFFVPASSIGSMNIGVGSPQFIGKINDISSDTITINSITNTPGIDDFIMFSKSKAVNNTSLLGYYAGVKINNNSKGHAELFALSSEITPSSK